jgi:O-antigen/teichoic acid export membrane protein
MQNKIIQILYQDNFFRELFKNATVLFAANFVASLFGFVSLALTARAIGAEQFGILILITTYVLIVSELINFQTWQTIIKYGVEVIEKDVINFSSLIKLGFILDVTAALLGTAIAIASILIIGEWRAWNEQHINMTIIYSFTILFNIQGTSIAILRLYNKFNKIAVHTIFVALIKLFGASVLFYLKADVWNFLIMWALTEIIGNLALITLSIKELRNNGIFKVAKISLNKISHKFKGIWSLFLTVNLSGTIRMATRLFDIMFVGYLLGPASVAVYKIAKQIADIPLKFIEPLQQVLYPYLAKLWAQDNIHDFKRNGRKLSVLIGLIGVAIFGLGYFTLDWFIHSVFGMQYTEAAIPALVLLGAYSFYYFGIHLRPQAIILGAHKQVLYIYIFSTIIFYLVYFILVKKVGIAGAALSHLIFFFIWFFSMIILVKLKLNFLIYKKK